MSYAALPAGANTVNVNVSTHDRSGNTWFQPAYGANGVHDLVVPAPQPKGNPESLSPECIPCAVR